MKKINKKYFKNLIPMQHQHGASAGDSRVELLGGKRLVWQWRAWALDLLCMCVFRLPFLSPISFSEPAMSPCWT